jgi:hypothetical protein
MEMEMVDTKFAQYLPPCIPSNNNNTTISQDLEMGPTPTNESSLRRRRRGTGFGLGINVVDQDALISDSSSKSPPKNKSGSSVSKANASRKSAAGGGAAAAGGGGGGRSAKRSTASAVLVQSYAQQVKFLRKELSGSRREHVKATAGLLLKHRDAMGEARRQQREKLIECEHRHEAKLREKLEQQLRIGAAARDEWLQDEAAKNLLGIGRGESKEQDITARSQAKQLLKQQRVQSAARQVQVVEPAVRALVGALAQCDGLSSSTLLVLQADQVAEGVGHCMELRRGREDDAQRIQQLQLELERLQRKSAKEKVSHADELAAQITTAREEGIAEGVKSAAGALKESIQKADEAAEEKARLKEATIQTVLASAAKAQQEQHDRALKLALVDCEAEVTHRLRAQLYAEVKEEVVEEMADEMVAAQEAAVSATLSLELGVVVHPKGQFARQVLNSISVRRNIYIYKFL